MARVRRCCIVVCLPRSGYQGRGSLAAARSPRQEAAAEVGDRVRHAIHTRHGGRLHTVLCSVVHHEQVPVPRALGPDPGGLLVHPHMCQQSISWDA